MAQYRDPVTLEEAMREIRENRTIIRIQNAELRAMKAFLGGVASIMEHHTKMTRPIDSTDMVISSIHKLLGEQQHG